MADGMLCHIMTRIERSCGGSNIMPVRIRQERRSTDSDSLASFFLKSIAANREGQTSILHIRNIITLPLNGMRFECYGPRFTRAK